MDSSSFLGRIKKGTALDRSAALNAEEVLATGLAVKARAAERRLRVATARIIVARIDWDIQDLFSTILNNNN